MLLKTYVKVRSILACEKGQGLMEYALLALLIAVALIGLVMTFRDTLLSKWDTIIKELGEAENDVP